MSTETLTFKIAADATKALQAIDSVGNGFKKLGRTVKEVTAPIAAFGAAMAHQAAKYDSQVKRAVDNLQGAYTSLSVSIGRALIPVINQLAGWIDRLTSAWDSLTPAQQQNIVEMATIAVKIGALVFVGSQLFDTLGDLAGVALTLGAPFFGMAAAIGAAAAAAITLYGALKLVQSAEGAKDRSARAQLGLTDAKFMEQQAREGQASARGELAQAKAAGAPDAVISRLQKSQDEAEAQYTAAKQKSLKALTEANNAAAGLAQGVDGFVDGVKDAFSTGVEALQKGIMDAVGLSGLGGGKKPKRYKPLKGNEKDKEEFVGRGVEEYYDKLFAEAEFRREQAAIEAANAMAAQEADFFIGMLEAQAEALKKVEDARQSMGQHYMGKTDTLGNVINAGATGAQAGGGYGAVIGVLLELITESKTFKDVIELVSQGFQTLADTLGGIGSAFVHISAIANQFMNTGFRALGPIFDALAKTLDPLIAFAMQSVDILTAFGPLLEVFGEAIGMVSGLLNDVTIMSFRPLFEVVKIFTVNIGKTVAAMIQSISITAGWVAQLLATLGMSKEATWLVEKVVIPLTTLSNNLNTSMSKLNEMTIEGTIARGKEVAATMLATEAMESWTESITNAPGGYKVGAAQYAAQDPQGAMGSGVSGSAAPIQVSVSVEIDGKEVAKSTKEEIERERTRKGKSKKTDYGW
jgi:hypothetical protein